MKKLITKHPILFLHGNAVVWFMVGYLVGNISVASVLAMLFGYLGGYLFLLNALDKRKE